MPRLFVALPMPETVAAELDRLCTGLPDARWADLDDFHLTLRFIGEVEPTTFYEIGEALASISLPPFDLRLRGLGQFPLRGMPKALWVGVEPSEGLDQLRRQVGRCVTGAGVEPERRKFIPHVTIARFRLPPPEARFASYLSRRSLFRTGDFPVSRFGLYSSLRRPEGAIHMIEAAYDFVTGVMERV